MKKGLALILSGALMIGALAGCSSKSGSEGAEGFSPSQTVSWYVTSSPGGGSDIYTRKISDIMNLDGIVSETIVVTNKTDGGGEVGRNEVANIKGQKADHTLLTFNSGDLMPMVLNTKNRSSNFKIVAVMAVDKQLIFKGDATKYNSFEEAIEAAKSGTKVVIGGSKGDDVATYQALIAELGLTQDQMSYITYDSTGDAITAILGGHIELLISKPAAATEYVEAGSLVPVLALSTERYTGNLADAPTLSEIGDYENVEVPVWRGVAAPASMSDEAVAYWSSALKTVSESEEWITGYLEKNKLISNYMTSEEATQYVTEFEKDYMEVNGIK